MYVCVCAHARVCLYASVIRRISSLFSLISRERIRQLNLFRRLFLVESPQQHREILTRMGLENFGLDPCFSNLRINMRELVEVLAAVAAGLPRQHYGFYRLEALLSLIISISRHSYKLSSFCLEFLRTMYQCFFGLFFKSFVVLFFFIFCGSASSAAPRSLHLRLILKDFLKK